MRIFNLGLRFVLELAALGALAYGGWRVPGPLWLRIILLVALPLVAAVIWGRWVAPRASRPLADPLRLVPEWVVLGGGVVALVLTGHVILGVLLGVLAAANRLALHLLGTGTGGDPQS